ncbi:MAG TPA: FHA domain-containing protein [Anaerolineae bacterium]|nr:FHA domain-containing protein [Anaerolineae bacterium]
MSEKREAALLLWMEGDEIKGRWTLDPPVTTIGRWHDNDVVVDDRWVSRYHARIVRRDDRYVVEDLDSKNGTFVNGQRIAAPVALHDGDQVQVTPLVKLTFVDYASTAPLPGEMRPAGLELDMGARQALVRGRPLDPPLSHAQFTLLELLAEEPGRVYSRDEIVAAVWPEDESTGVSDEAIDALVRRVRLRLRELDPATEYLVTVRGYGFKLEPQGE